MQHKIFAVEDDPLIIEVIRAQVIGRGWLFEAADMFDGAVEAIRRFESSLVLLDITLPDGNGLDICRALRADRAFDAVPIIMVTSRTEAQKRREAFAAGVQDYVIKPFDDFELMARMNVHLAEQVRSGVRSSEQSTQRLHDRLRMDVFDMIVHDMRAPLATVKLLLDVTAMKGEKTAFSDRFMEITKTSVETALLMMNDHLDVSTNRVEVHRERLSLKDLFQRLQTVMAPQYASKDVRLSFDFSPSTSVLTDGIILFRVLQNLLANAFKFSHAGETVTARARIAKDQLILEVIDQGPGIKDKAGLFTRPRTAPSGDGKQGFGIGLGFCRLAAGALGGSIRVEDADGGGSRFVFECPTEIAPVTTSS